jgi:iron complex transport system ATP-binding protein
MASERAAESDAESETSFAALLDRATVVTGDGRRLLGPVSVAIRKGEHWAVLGPNGAGKTTLLRLLGGARLGSSDLRLVRSRVGVVSHAVADRLPPSASALDVVLTGGRNVLAPWWARTGQVDRVRGLQILAALGCAGLADRAFGSCSQGERQRVLLARSLFVEHPLLLLDEPCAGVDLPGREALVLALTALARSAESPVTVHVSHSLEELPATTSHVLMLREGEVVAMGPVEEVMTEPWLKLCFGLAISLSREDGRWAARASPSW